MSIIKSKSSDKENEMTKGVLLILDDEKEVLNALSRVFRGTYNVEVASNTQEAYEILTNSNVQVILSDQRMPDMKGTQFFSQIRETYKDIIRVLITGYSSLDDVILAINEGNVYKYLTKPWDLTELKTAVHQSFKKAEIIEENKRIIRALEKSKESLDDLVRLRTREILSENGESETLKKEVDLESIDISYNELIEQMKKLEKEITILEAQLRNQQKLESIGTLASGVAHEINNPINGILNYGQLILDSRVEEYEDIKEYASEIIQESNRVSEIVKNLLDFSRHNNNEHSYANIEDIISKTLSLIKIIIKHNQIELNLHIDENIPRIKCNSQQIQQVIMNLVINAKDALNLKYPAYDINKKINIKCMQYSSDGQEWIRLVVEDFGSGISKDILDRIFDPFFTTKGRAEGTGLGLSIIYNIVREHLGEITVETEEGKFTRFIVNLPCDNA